MFIKKKVIMKLFKRKDSNEISLLKKRLFWNLLNVKIPTKYVYLKKVIVKVFKPKDSNKCVYKKKKGYCETF